jgi:hypothetical protein
MNKRTVITVMSSVALALGAWAQQHEKYPAFQASLVPDYAIYERSQRIEGLTLSIWGENPQTALSIGLVNGSCGESVGMSLGVLNYAESYSGVQWAFANFTGQDCYGWQGGPGLGLVISVLNYTGGHMNGLQTGLVNIAGKLSGLQFGLINYTQTADQGVQIGLVNMIAENQGWFTQWPNEVAPGMILANWRF